MAVPVDVIVEGQLLVLLNIALCKDAHAHPLAYSPFRNVAVGVAAVVGKAPDAAVLGCVDELVFLEHHEVKVLDALFSIVAHAFLELFVVDDIANVLVDEGIPIMGR